MKSTQIHAFDDDALGKHDAVALTELLERRSVSSSELVEAAITRAERVDGVLAAIQLRDYDKARAVTELPYDGIFAGIPSFIKDNTNIAGWPTAHAVAGLERFWRNRKLPEVGLVEGPGKRKLRIGLMMHSLVGEMPCEQTRSAVDSIARLLESEGHSIVPVSQRLHPILVTTGEC